MSQESKPKPEPTRFFFFFFFDYFFFLRSDAEKGFTRVDVGGMGGERRARL